MTTILADARTGIIVSDSNASDDDRTWSERKIFRYRGQLYGFCGLVSERVEFMEWIHGGPIPDFGHSQCLLLNTSGLFLYDESPTPQRVPRGIEAIGTGGKAAICAYEALGWMQPKLAVQIVCKHDAASRTPVRGYRLKP